MTVSQLGFAIDSSQAAAAASDLDKLTSSATRAEQAATKVSGAGTRMSRGFADLNPALEKIIGSLGRLEGITTSIDKRLDAMSQAAGRTAKSNGVLEKSAIEASTAYKQLEASLNAMQVSQGKADAAQTKSLSQIDKQREAIARLNAELQKLRAAPPPSVPNSPRSPANNNGSQGNVGNVAAQLFDIGTTAAFMNPATVAIQQGPQLAQAFAGQSSKQALTSLAGGLAAIVSPMSLVAIGLTATAAAAIQYGVGLATAATETKKLDDVLGTHEGLLKQIDERYGSLTAKARGFASETANVLGFQSSSDVRALRSATNRAQYDVFDQTGSILGRVRGGTAGGNDLSVDSAYAPIEGALRRLRAGAKEGKPDFDAFYDSLYKAASLDPKFAKKADDLALLIEQYRQGTKALQEMERVQRAVFDDRGPNGMLLSRGTTNTADMGNLALFQSQQRVAAQRQQQGFDAQISGLNARSPQERAASARASAAAQYNNDETAVARRTRIEQAGLLALAQAEKQLADARRDRAMNLDKILQDQQSEIDLVGKTGGAAAALRKEYELTSALRMEAARQGIDVDQHELDLIKQRAAALGELTDRYNQSRFNFDMGQQTSDAMLSPRDRQIKTTLRQYGLPEDLSGANAARVGQQVDWQQAKDLAKGFGAAFSSELVSGSHDIGKSLLKGLQSSLESEASKLWEKFFDSAGNIFASWLTGTPGAGSIGAMGSVVSAIGGKPANDNAAGAFSGIGKIIPVTGAPIGDISPYAKAIQSIESSGNYGTLGPITKNGDRALGAYQMMGNNIGPWSKETLGRSISAEEFLKNPSLQDQIFDKKFGGYVSQYGPSGAAQAWFGGPGSVGKGGGAADMLGTTGTAYVDKFNAALGDASKDVGTFGNGLGKLGQSLSSSYFPSAPSSPSGGGGGLFGWLGSLFGGSFKPVGAQAGIAAAGGIGLYADGTSYAPGGMAIVGERGPELVDLPQGSQVFNTNKSRDLMRGSGGGDGSIAGVRVFVDQDGNWQAKVESISRRTSQRTNQSSLVDQNEQMRRGGFGEMQRRYASQKG